MTSLDVCTSTAMSACPAVTPSIQQPAVSPGVTASKAIALQYFAPCWRAVPRKCTFGMHAALVPLCAAFAPQPLLPRTLASPRLAVRAAVRAAVAESEEVDFVVVGSGIGGLSCAGLLAASGYEVATLPRCQPLSIYILACALAPPPHLCLSSTLVSSARTRQAPPAPAPLPCGRWLCSSSTMRSAGAATSST